jgi:tetratricopeptide (TPR) repeat protein
MMKLYALSITTLLAFGISAQAATLTYGDNSALTCARAAQAEEPNASISSPAHRAALKSCNAALADKLRPEDRTATLVNRGILLTASGQTDAAIADFNAALERNASLTDAYVSRGAAHMRAGHFTEARADFEKALGMGAAHPEQVYFNRGMANERLGDLAGAYRDYRQAQTLNPDFAPARFELARFQVMPKRIARN